MTELTHGTWVVIANGEKALFLVNRTDAADPHLQVVRTRTQDNPASAEQGSDRPGRRADTGVGQRSALQETDWHGLAKDRFADDLAGILNGLALAGRFDRLVLCAAPETLGEVRAKLSDTVKARLVGEIAKELVNHPLDEIERIVIAALADDDGDRLAS